MLSEGTLPARRGVTARLVDATAVPARPAVGNRIGNVRYMTLPGNRRTLSGSFVEVATLVEYLDAKGDLARASNPVPAATGRPDDVMVTITLASPVAARQVKARRRLPRWARWAVGSTAAAFLGLLVWAALMAVAWIVGHILIVLLVLAGLAIVSSLGGPRVVQVLVSVIVR